MISAPTFTIKGSAGEKTNLPAEVFGVEVSPALLAQAVRVHLSNQRKARAKTKTRGEVAKTTAKMYKQKGTGRARHGAYSAPIFVGGGIAHGPDGKQNWKRKLTATMSKKALLGALSLKAADKKLGVVSGADKASGKTKDVTELLKKMGTDFERALVVVSSQQKEIIRSLRNIRNIDLVERERLNTYQVLGHPAVIITSEAVTELKEYASTK